MITLISKKNFKHLVTDNTGLALVQFKNEWSGSSQILSMIYDDLETSYRHAVSFFTVDAKKGDDLNAEFGVTELPTILFFKAGEIIDHAKGLIPKKVLISKIEKALNQYN